MTFELLISTMQKKNMKDIRDMLARMNVKCDCIVINQCDEKNEFFENNGEQKIHAIFTNERGLSKSRNLALKKSKADIVAIADDDLYYYDNFDKKIISYYEKNNRADIVLFGIDSYRIKCSNKEMKCKFLKLGSYISVQTSLNRTRVLQRGIFFNELFGTGSGVYNSGEENIFLADCYKQKLRIFYCPDKILKHEESESSWFTGYNEKFLSDRGAIYQAVYGSFSILYILRFIFIYKKLFAPITPSYAFRLMILERKKFKKYKCIF